MAYFDFGTWSPESGRPRWAADFRSRDHLIPGGVKLDAAAFPADDTVTVTVGAGGAVAGATSVPVNALSGRIPAGAFLDFTGAGKYAKLTAEAVAGATTITVEALVQALAAGDTATHLGQNKKFVPSGTVLGRTQAEADANAPFGPAVATDSENQVYLLAFDVDDAAENNDGVLYRHNAVVKENLLPGWSTLAAGVQGMVRTKYNCIRGIA